jgi:hypothetical protein
MRIYGNAAITDSVLVSDNKCFAGLRLQLIYLYVQAAELCAATYCCLLLLAALARKTAATGSTFFTQPQRLFAQQGI